MRVKCVENKISILPESFLKYYRGDVQAPLIIDKNYMVYAVYEVYDTTWFCIDDEQFRLPRWHPKFFFEIDDQRLSKYWILSFQGNSKNIMKPFLGFPEWANNEYFYVELIDGDGERESYDVFHKYKTLMYMEFPDLAIVETAQIGDDEWLICPLCIDAWKSNTQDALVACPMCKTIFNNPRYKNELPSYKLSHDV